MNEQVFTTMTSASSGRAASSAPARPRIPIITSLSTRFLGHPRLTNPTLVVLAPPSEGPSPAGTVRTFSRMQSFYFSIHRPAFHTAQFNSVLGRWVQHQTLEPKVPREQVPTC